MGDRPVIHDIPAERQVDYGNSWQWPQKVLMCLPFQLVRELMITPYWHAWYMIIVKLLRALVSPTKRDHWDDIIGYAQLALSAIPESEVDNAVQDK